MEPECPWVEEYPSALRVHLQNRPMVTAILEEIDEKYCRDTVRGRVSYSITGYLTPIDALRFSSAVCLAAQLAAAWEAGNETRESVLKVYGKEAREALAKAADGGEG